MQTEMLYGNGLKTKYSYDERNQLTGIIAGVEGKPSIFEAKYSYNGNGNRITKDEQVLYGLDTHITSLHTEYSYDSMNRLTGENLNGTLTSYSYDLAGNRTTKTVEGRKESYLYKVETSLQSLWQKIRRYAIAMIMQEALLKKNTIHQMVNRPIALHIAMTYITATSW